MSSCCEIQPQRKADEDVAQVQYYRPDVDVFENEAEVTLFADLPGTSVENINVEYDKGKLTVRAQTPPRSAPEGAKLLVQEYGIGDFYRSFEVSEAVDVDSAQASYTNGVLQITLKKHRNGQRKIPITVN